METRVRILENENVTGLFEEIKYLLVAKKCIYDSFRNLKRAFQRYQTWSTVI